MSVTQITFHGGQCNNSATLELTAGLGTYVAADGDSIVVVYSGQASLSPAGFDGYGRSATIGLRAATTRAS